MLGWLTVGLGVASAAEGLHLGERIFLVEGGSWRLPTLEVSLKQGFAFEVLDAEEQPAGQIFIGLAEGEAPLDPRRACAWPVGLAPEGPLRGGAALVLGLTADPEAPGYLEVRPEGKVIYQLEATVPTVISIGLRDLAQAQAKARQALTDRTRALADAGLPTQSLLALAGERTSPALIELDGGYRWARLVGNTPGDGWWTALEQGGAVGHRGPLTLVWGARETEPSSGT